MVREFFNIKKKNQKLREKIDVAYQLIQMYKIENRNLRKALRQSEENRKELFNDILKLSAAFDEIKDELYEFVEKGYLEALREDKDECDLNEIKESENEN